MKRLRFQIGAVLIVALALWLGTSAQPESLVLLHLNDTHGQLSTRQGAEQGPEGGAARLASMVATVRAENPGRVLLLHAGDVMSRGDPVTVYSGGAANFDVMNRIGYDAFTPGNGDFYWDIETLLERKRQAEFPFTLANVVCKQGGQTLLEPYVVKEAGGVRVGILGLGVIRGEHPSARTLRLLDPFKVAAEYVPRLQEKADLVVALTHIGNEADQRLAALVPGIDIIVGGHSHTAVEEPQRVPHADGEGETVVVQAGDLYRFLGRVDVELQRTSEGWDVTRIEARLMPLDNTVPEDPGIVARLAQHAAPLKETLCAAAVAVENPETGESPMGRLVVDAMRTATGADVVLLDRGGVCAGIEPGNVTIEDVCRIHPWRNRVFTIEMTGEQLGQTLTDEDLLFSGCSLHTSSRGKLTLRVGDARARKNGVYSVAVGEYLYGTTESLRDLPCEVTPYRVDTILTEHLRGRGTAGGQAIRQK